MCRLSHGASENAFDEAHVIFHLHTLEVFARRERGGDSSVWQVVWSGDAGAMSSCGKESCQTG